MGLSIPQKLLSSSSPGLLSAVWGGWEEERGRRFAADTLFFSLQTQAEQQHRPVLRLQAKRPNIIKITSLVSFTANHPDRSPAHAAITGVEGTRSANVIPGHGHLCAV